MLIICTFSLLLSGSAQEEKDNLKQRRGGGSITHREREREGEREREREKEGEIDRESSNAAGETKQRMKKSGRHSPSLSCSTWMTSSTCLHSFGGERKREKREREGERERLKQRKTIERGE